MVQILCGNYILKDDIHCVAFSSAKASARSSCKIAINLFLFSHPVHPTNASKSVSK